MARAFWEYTINMNSEGGSNYNHAGNSLRIAGNVNGDGLNDLIVGAYKNDDGGTDAGKAYLILSGL